MENDPEDMPQNWPLWSALRPRRPVPLDLDSESLATLPGRVPLVDTRHPERLDWREVGLAIDLDEGRWHHFLIAPKPGGRTIHELAHCPVMAALMADLLTRLYCGTLGDGGDPLSFPQGIPPQRTRLDPLTAAPAVSFHADAKAMARLREMSAHERRARAATWRAMADAMDAVRAAEPGR